MCDNQLVKRVVELAKENEQLLSHVQDLEQKLNSAQEDIAAMLKTFGYNLFVCKYCKHNGRNICDNCDDAEWRYKDER